MKKPLRHFSTMTEPEMKALQNAVQRAAVAFAVKRGFSGLSHAGWFSFYTALQDAVRAEWRKATAPEPADSEED